LSSFDNLVSNAVCCSALDEMKSWPACVHPRETFQELLAVGGGRFLEDGVDEAVHADGFRSRRVGLRDDQLAQRDDELVLLRVEDARRPVLGCDRCIGSVGVRLLA
jgi:hypothetical protein